MGLPKLPTIIRMGGCCCATAPNCNCRWPIGFTVTKQDYPTPGYVIVCCDVDGSVSTQTILTVDMSPLNAAINLVRDGPWVPGDPAPSYTSTNGLWKLTPTEVFTGVYVQNLIGTMPIPGHTSLSIIVDYFRGLSSGHTVSLDGIETYCRDDGAEVGGSNMNPAVTVPNIMSVAFDFILPACPTHEGEAPGPTPTFGGALGPVHSPRDICPYLGWHGNPFKSAQRYTIQPAIFTPTD